MGKSNLIYAKFIIKTEKLKEPDRDNNYLILKVKLVIKRNILVYWK